MIKFIVFDFDGVFTDGKISFDNKGNAIKYYNAKDGNVIFRLKDKNILTGVISGWKNNTSQKSILEHLKFDKISLGSDNKLFILKDWCKELNISLEEVAYIGDDLNDLMTLCRADITTKNPDKVKRYLNNFKKVEEKMKNVLKLDSMKAFQSPVRGKEIMSICQIPESKTVGKIKSAIENAILEGEIDNTYEASLNYLMKIKHHYLD